jgi:hypothetical protein
MRSSGGGGVGLVLRPMHWHGMHVERHGGRFELLALLGAAVVLELLQKGQRAFELAGEALAVEAQSGESLGVAVEGIGDAQGLTHLVGSFVEPQILMDHAEHEQVVFERGGAVESPGGIGESLDELSLGGALGWYSDVKARRWAS